MALHLRNFTTLGLADTTIRKAIRMVRIAPDECRKTGYGTYGGIWLVKESAVRRLYGKPKLSQFDINEKD